MNMSDKLLQHLLQKHDRYKFSKSNMSQNVTDVFPMDPNKLFKVEAVEKLVYKIIDSNVDESHMYDAEESPKLCISLTEEIRKHVKELNFERYKIICIVQIFEKKRQGISSSAQLLCDMERDRYVIVRKEYNNFFLVASVYGFYYF